MLPKKYDITVTDPGARASGGDSSVRFKVPPTDLNNQFPQNPKILL